MNIPTRKDYMVRAIDGQNRHIILSVGEKACDQNMVKFLLENDPFVTRSGMVVESIQQSAGCDHYHCDCPPSKTIKF